MWMLAIVAVLVSVPALRRLYSAWSAHRQLLRRIRQLRATYGL